MFLEFVKDNLTRIIFYMLFYIIPKLFTFLPPSCFLDLFLDFVTYCGDMPSFSSSFFCIYVSLAKFLIDGIS